MNGRLPVAGDELDVELLHATGQHTDGRNLRVMDVDHLAVQRAQLRAAKRDVLDDTLHLHHRDRDRVPD